MHVPDRLRRAGLVTASAVLYALAFPPRSLWPLAWVALVPLLAALARASTAERIAIGAAWSVLAGWGVGTWMPTAVAHYFDQPWWVGLGLFLVVAGGMAAPYYAGFAALVPRLGRIGGFAAPLLLGIAWAAAELARGRLLNDDWLYTGNSPWATLGYSQTPCLPVLQIASVFGVYGVSFVVASTNAALAQAAGWIGPRDRRGLVSVGAVLLLVLAYGGVSLRAEPPHAPARSVAYVQPALEAAGRWQTGGEVRSLDTYLRLTRDRLADSGVDLVVWPEAALPFFLEDEALYRRGIGGILHALDAELLVGSMARSGTPEAPRYLNSAFVLRAGGEIAGRYDKVYLLPFMEYFPLRVDLLQREFGRVREFSPGEPKGPLPTPVGPAAVLLCNEAFLPHVARRRVRDGARWLVSPSSDGWVEDEGFAEHQLQIASLRAVETRTPLLRASDTGPSALVDAWGRISARSRPLTEAVEVVPVSPGPANALYLTLGDWPIALSGLIVVVIALRPGLVRPDDPR